MPNNILLDVKNALMMQPEDVSFDSTILMHIEGAIASLKLMGAVEVNSDFVLTSETIWSDIPVVEPQTELLPLIKNHMFVYTRILFDPPTGAAANAFNSRKTELENVISLTIAIPPVVPVPVEE